MATGVRFNKEERELIRTWAAADALIVRRDTGKRQRLAQQILDKLEKSEMLKPSDKPKGIGWTAAAAAMREVLGPSLAVPKNPSVEWMVKMNNRIRDLGLSSQDCRSIAQVLAVRKWSTYSFEKTIYNADILLAQAQLEMPVIGKRDNAPLEM